MIKILVKQFEKISRLGMRKYFREVFKIIHDYIEQVRVIGLLFLSGIKFRKWATTSNGETANGRKMLIISYFSPPYRSSQGTQRMMKFIKYLARRGWHITVLTSELPEREPREEFADPFPPSVRVVRIPPTRLRSVITGRGRFVPDDFIRWVRPAVKKAKEIIEEERPAIIFSTAPPYSNMIVGTISASKAGKIPHIPDFRDPWTRIDVAWIIKGRFLKWLNKKMEREVIRRSHHVIMADELVYLDDFFLDEVRSLNVPIVSITNGFDEEDFNERLRPVGKEEEKFSISYIGVFYDQETFENVLNPFLIWAAHHPEDMRQVRFLYAGASSNFFDRARALPFELKNYGFLAHLDAIALRYKSHVQVFAQPSNFKAHVYSGKIFEMIRTPVPILAITRKDGAVAGLLAKTRTGLSVSQGRSEEAAGILKQLFDCWKNGKQNYNPDCAEVRRYAREALANRLAEILGSYVTDKNDKNTARSIPFVTQF